MSKATYCLLLGLEHDVEFMDKIPYEEQRYLLNRIAVIKRQLNNDLTEKEDWQHEEKTVC